MASKYHGNCVVTGPADSYCLTCQMYLAKKEIDPHISTPSHKNSLESTVYVDTIEEDRIRKVKIGYYCEICNLLLQTRVKVDIHIKIPDHVTKKNNQLIEEVDEGIIAFDDILIEKRCWNGLDGGTCYVCNIDYCDENDHRNDSYHILNLIQAKLELKRNESVYRKMDESFFNCIICNGLINAELKDKHSKEPSHIIRYTRCRENKKKFIVVQTEIEPSPSQTNIDTDTVTEKDQEVKITPIQHGDCVQVISNDLTPNSSSDDSKNILTPADALNRAMLFAKANKLKYKRTGTYCKTCDIKISSSLKKMKEHVEEPSHKKKSACVKKVDKKPMNEFIFSVRNQILLDDVVINFEFWISQLSFQMIINLGTTFRCQSCEVSINKNELDMHKVTYKHNQAMQITPVLIGFKTEFIREVRPGIYHCGFCNFIEGSWEGLKSHLKSDSHINSKRSASYKRGLFSFL